MAEESDGIEEAFEGQLRVLVTAAGQVGERIARMREEAMRRAQARSEQQARELQSRFEAERRAARVELGNVYRSDWWDRASAEQVAQTYQVARAWARDDPDAARAEEHMRTEMRTRYGLDPDERARAAAEAVQRDALGDWAREDGRSTYDSAGRRDATASELRARGIASEVVDTRMRADVSQARPATEAVGAAAAGRSLKTRKSRGRVAHADRTGLDR